MKYILPDQYKVIIIAETANFIPYAQEIAARFNALVYKDSDYKESPDTNDEILIFIGVSGISIKLSDNKGEKPVYIDFSSDKMQYRKNNSGTRKEKIARAVGLKSGKPLNILDATAGLGGDSFILASLGANLTMLERNPFVYLLLEDALNRGKSDIKIAEIINHMELVNDDSISFLDSLAIKPDVIYMDPMFPDKTKTALSKKEMRLFRVIAGKDTDATDLFTKALNTANKRVVIKRPAKTPYITETKPSFSIEGKAARFDVYIK